MSHSLRLHSNTCRQLPPSQLPLQMRTLAAATATHDQHVAGDDHRSTAAQPAKQGNIELL
jgi:hypothetical protein